ncbi:MAG: dephospho-CoA kinase [Spirochaetaceae bacterium]|nr:dephospho-CoA kinase [Spirochaetaceae bacterium]
MATIICVTGKMAAGKNAVCDILSEKGWFCIDLDVLSHGALEEAQDCVIAEFSPENSAILLNDDGKISRKKLAEIVFKNKENLRRLENILHPVIEKMTLREIEKSQSKKIVINATVLYKTNLLSLCSAIIFVDASPILRLIRCRKRNKMKFSQIFKRFFIQKDLFSQYSRKNSDIYIVDNSNSLDVLKNNVNTIIENIDTNGD